MRLWFDKKHLSITAFPKIELPKFTTIVGLNGSGKTHLLQAIANGSIPNSISSIDANGMPSPDASQIKLITQTAEKLASPAYRPQDLTDPMEMMEPVARYEETRTGILRPFRQRLEEISDGAIGKCLQTGEDPWILGVIELSARTGIDTAEITQVFNDAEAQLRPSERVSPMLRGGMSNPLMALQYAADIADKLGRSILEVQTEHLRLFNKWGTSEQFSLNLALVFGNYRDAWARNTLLRVHGKSASAYLDDEEFNTQFGMPPWDEINQALQDFALPYEVTVPDCSDRGPVTVSLGSGPIDLLEVA